MIFQRIIQRIRMLTLLKSPETVVTTIPSLYDTVKDWKTVLDMAWSLSEIKCPGCGKKLNRKAIWAE